MESGLLGLLPLLGKLLPRGRLFGAGYNYFAIDCLDAIPFMVVAAAVTLQGSFRKESQSLQFGLVAAEIATIVLGTVYQTAVWFNVLGRHPVSLIGIAFIIFPVLITAVSIVVEVIGVGRRSHVFFTSSAP